MFSVNNFYDIFNSHYGYPKKNNTVWSFSPHGSKNLLDLTKFGNSRPDMHLGAIIMHDQEPFFTSELSALQSTLTNRLTYIPNNKQHWYYNIVRMIDSEFAKILTPAESLQYYVRSTETPIICHSERNSTDIKYLEDNNFISCYYWWHGMISIDWFRHWEYHANLGVYNKAQSQTRFLFYSRDTTGTRKYRTKALEQLSGYSIKTSNQGVSSDASATIDVDDANTTSIHIVGETLFDTDKVHLTEKIFKPIVMSQPFILFSAAGSLRYLRSYGFKTFHDIWDESYDDELNSDLRFQMVVNLIEKLNLMSTPDLASLYQRLLPIISFNRAHFYSKKFRHILWSELTKNVEDALKKQEEARSLLPGGTDFYLYNLYLQKTQKLLPGADVLIRNTIENQNLSINHVLAYYPQFTQLLKQD